MDILFGLSKLNAAGTVLELWKYMAAAEFNAEIKVVLVMGWGPCDYYAGFEGTQ